MVKLKAIVFDLGDTIIKYSNFVPLIGTRTLMEEANNPNNITVEEIQNYADALLSDIGLHTNSRLV